MNKGFHFEGLLQQDGWLCPAYVRLDERGRITDISIAPQADTTYERVPGYALPGLPNAHSHAFQYAMAGMNERHDLGGRPDDFWSWREAMYRLALQMEPDQMEVIAAMLYAEMVRHGYTSVAEFHYLHHDPKGKPYADLAEMGSRLVAAAHTAGIRITLIPIFYQKGGFGRPPAEEQRRFISRDLDAYLHLFEASRRVTREYERAAIGYGVHSLRAVAPGLIRELAAQADPRRPFHLHIAEQQKEVEESMTALGKRPVEWLTDNLELTDQYHLVHATHLTRTETLALARSEAHVVLCPTTEGNLGDGMFSLSAFQSAGGRWSIGTDSHVSLNPFEELRLLDYGQRLTTHRRNIFYAEDMGDSGLYALRQMVGSGRKAMGVDQPAFFATGRPLDALVMDARSPLVAVSSTQHLTNTFVYASDASMHYGTLIDGAWVVRQGVHRSAERIREAFMEHMKGVRG